MSFTHCIVAIVAELKAEAVRIESETELECQVEAREAEVSFIREQNELEIEKAKALTQVEVCACNSGFHSKYLRSETILVAMVVYMCAIALCVHMTKHTVDC